MKTPKVISAAALTLLAAASVAHAEDYVGAHPLSTQLTRTEVQTDAVTVARAGNVYGDGYFAGVPQVDNNSPVERNTIRAQAVATAHNPLQNLDSKAFVDSRIPDQYTKGSLVRQQQAQQVSLPTSSY